MSEAEEKKHQKYVEYLDQFLQLKHAYESKNRLAAKKQKGYKPLCIQCQKAGGTTFSMKANRYTAVCGAQTNCGLHLELFRGGFIDSSAAFSQYRAVLEDSKDAIIRLKNDELYHYVADKDAKKTFEQENAHYETVNTLFTDLHKCMNENPVISKRIEDRTQEIGEVMLTIHGLVNDYKKSLNTEFLQQAVTEERTRLLPLVDELRGLKYGIVEMEVRLKDPTSTKEIYVSRLIERRLRLAEDEINLKEAPEVKKWNFNEGL
jgi:hypothetical protein